MWCARESGHAGVPAWSLVSAVIVDDMISTDGTVEAAVRVLLARGAARDITAAATHGLLVEAVRTASGGCRSAVCSSE